MTDSDVELHLQRAMDSEAALDYGARFAELSAAVRASLATDSPDTGLFHRVAVAALRAGRTQAGLDLLDGFLRAGLSARLRGYALLARSLLVLETDLTQRSDDLFHALHAFSASGESEGEALTLAELAMPIGTDLTVQDRADFAHRAIERAVEARVSGVKRLAGAHLALALLCGGRSGEAWDAWNSLRPSLQVGSKDDFRLGKNWVAALFAAGWLTHAETALRDLKKIAIDPERRARCDELDLLIMWRRGRWNEMPIDRLQEWRLLSRGETQATTLVIGSIALERERTPDTSSLLEAADALALGDPVGGISKAVAMRCRVARKEPAPARGLTGVIERAKATGFRIGWEDFLVASAEVGRVCYERTVGALELDDSAPRVAPSRSLASAIRGEGGTEGSLENALDAAEGFGGISEPYPQAQALDLAARILHRSGKRAGGYHVQAAEIYRTLGAHRSLASLLRRFRGSDALSTFSQPESHQHLPALGLTVRESEVAELAAAGYPVPRIAELLGIGPATATSHLKSARRKLGVSRKSELVDLIRAR